MTLIDQAMMKAFQRREQPKAVHAWTETLPAQSRAAVSDQLTSPGGPQLEAARRELYVHSPETVLRGMHQHPLHPPSVKANPVARVEFPDEELTGHDHSDPTSPNDLVDEEMESAPATTAVEAVMNSLLSYELSIQGPHLETWQIATDTVATPLPPVTAAATSPREKFADAVSESMSPRMATFKPAWETDAFRMTDACRQIQSQMQDHLQRAAATLIDDCVGHRPIIHVTGCGRSEGRSTISILLARRSPRPGCELFWSTEI